MYDPKRLQKLRDSNNLTQEDIVDRTGISIAQVRRHEKDSMPNSNDLLRYADLYNVSTDYLLGLSDEKYPSLQNSNLTEKEQDIIFAYRNDDLKLLLRTILNSM